MRCMAGPFLVLNQMSANLLDRQQKGKCDSCGVPTPPCGIVDSIATHVKETHHTVCRCTGAPCIPAISPCRMVSYLAGRDTRGRNEPSVPAHAARVESRISIPRLSQKRDE